MKKVLFILLFVFLSNVSAYQSNIVTIKKGAIFCMSSRALLEVHRKFGARLYDKNQIKKIEPYLFQSNCSNADNDSKIYINVTDYGKAELEFAADNGYLPFTFSAPDMSRGYGFVMVRDIK